MKTKSLILTALLTVAGSAGLMAQSNVYSLNIVGYVNQVIPSGYSIVANQLDASPDNKIPTIFPNPPDQTIVYKFNRATGGYQLDQYFAGAGWFGDDDNMTLGPGEGAFINTLTKFTNTFVGQLRLSSTNSIPTGYSIVSSAIPQAGNLDSLNFPHTDQISIYQFNPATGGYIVNQYFNGAGWFGDTTSGDPTSPAVAVGEGFFVSTPTLTSWNRNFSVGP